MTPPSALLFDLGGVLIDIDFARALKTWAAQSSLSETELRQAFKFDDAYVRHERGEISGTEYFEHLALTLRLGTDLAAIEDGWNSIFVREITETSSLIRSARSKVPCYAFTNTNASHMTRWSSLFPEVVAAFEHIFTSHQMGLRKPERAAFNVICQALALPPESILFFDDLAENVVGAQEAGLRAVLVRSPLDVANALRAAGVA